MGMYTPPLLRSYLERPRFICESRFLLFYLTPPLGLEKKKLKKKEEKPLMQCQRRIELEAQELRPMWWAAQFHKRKKKNKVWFREQTDFVVSQGIFSSTYPHHYSSQFSLPLHLIKLCSLLISIIYIAILVFPSTTHVILLLNFV